jgi:hypothetical protein
VSWKPDTPSAALSDTALSNTLLNNNGLNTPALNTTALNNAALNNTGVNNSMLNTTGLSNAGLNNTALREPGYDEFGGDLGERVGVLLAAAFGTAPGAVALVRDHDHRVDFLNRAFREAFGLSAEVCGPLARLVPQFEQLGLLDALDHVYATGTVFTAPEVRVTGFSAAKRPAVLRVTCSPVHHPDTTSSTAPIRPRPWTGCARGSAGTGTRQWPCSVPCCRSASRSRTTCVSRAATCPAPPRTRWSPRRRCGAAPSNPASTRSAATGTT